MLLMHAVPVHAGTYAISESPATAGCMRCVSLPQAVDKTQLVAAQKTLNSPAGRQRVLRNSSFRPRPPQLADERREPESILIATMDSRFRGNDGALDHVIPGWKRSSRHRYIGASSRASAARPGIQCLSRRTTLNVIPGEPMRDPGSSVFREGRTTLDGRPSKLRPAASFSRFRGNDE
jgi:hypothetical protein